MDVVYQQDRRILCVGLLCLDHIVVAKEYPAEDSDARSLYQQWQRGGNASNNCTVLSCLRASCELLATLDDSSDLGESLTTKFLLHDLGKDGICIDNCVYHSNAGFPTSVVIINSQNGSRTILHQKKNLPELCYDDFKKLDLHNYKWIHFEGRNPTEYSRMLQMIDEFNSHQSAENAIQVSVELEKPTIDYQLLSPFADVLFISKDLAKHHGFQSKESVAKEFKAKMKAGAIVICPWGEDGVAARTSDGNVITSKAHKPTKIVDTLGAGDVFNASTIYALSNGLNLQTSLDFGCRMAGEKCGIFGYAGLRNIALQIYKDIAANCSANRNSS